MTDKLKTNALDSQLAYLEDDRPTVDELIEKKVDEKSNIVQFNSKDYNELVEQTILCHQALEIAESNLLNVIDDYNDRERKIMEKGFKMLSEPFIPEYVGFKPEGAQGGSTLYSKEGKTIASSKGKWILFGVGDTPIHLKFTNMYQAVVSLSALGVTATIDEVLNS